MTNPQYGETQELGIDQVMTREYISDRYTIDTTPYTGRYFYVTSIPWAETAPRYSLLAGNNYSIPGSIFRNNIPLRNLINSAAFYRMKLVMSVAIGGTIVHGGSLLVAAIPPATSEFFSGPNQVNTLMSCPHGFLYASQATALELSIPWYCNTDYAPVAVAGHSDFNIPTGAYSSLVIMVMNPLFPGGGTTSLNLTISARFEELELKVPAPNAATWQNPREFVSESLMQSESLIGTVASGLQVMANAGKSIAHATGDIFDRVSKISGFFTGLHNPNRPTITERVITTTRNHLNTVDVPQFFEKLDPYPSTERTTDEYLFGTEQDEMSIRYIVAKEQYLGAIRISTKDVVGKLLWARPMTPYQTFEPIFSNNISLIYYLTRAWNGEFEMVFRCAGSAKQQVKVLLSRFYSPNRDVYNRIPTMYSSVNTLSQILEFSQGGQEHVCSFPYLSPLEITPCTMDYSTGASMNGEYYVYLAQPLVIGDNSPDVIEINVFIRSKSLNFYGYSLNSPVYAITRKEEHDDDNDVQYGDDLSDKKEKEISKPRLRRRSSVASITEPVIMSTKTRTTQMRSESGPPNFSILGKMQPQDGATVSEKPGIVSSRVHQIHHGRDIIRRMYKVGNLKLQFTFSNRYSIPLASLIGSDSPPLFMSDININPLSLYLSMFYGRQIGFKIRVKLNYKAQGAATGLTLSYLPPQPILRYSGSDAAYFMCFPNPKVAQITSFPVPVTDNFSYTVIGDTVTAFAECVIPNVTLVKFVNVNMSGVPFQPADNLFIQDHGRLIIEGDKNTISVMDGEIYVGLTDESRVGFHTIAPVVAQQIPNGDSYYFNGPYYSNNAGEPITLIPAYSNITYTQGTVPNFNST